VTGQVPIETKLLSVGSIDDDEDRFSVGRSDGRRELIFFGPYRGLILSNRGTAPKDPGPPEPVFSLFKLPKLTRMFDRPGDEHFGRECRDLLALTNPTAPKPPGRTLTGRVDRNPTHRVGCV